MSDSDTDAPDVCDRESVQVRFTASKEWVEDHLLPAYEEAVNVPQAARMACKDGVDATEGEDAVHGHITAEVLDALRELGGTVENCQTIRIGDADEVVVEDTEQVDVDVDNGE